MISAFAERLSANWSVVVLLLSGGLSLVVALVCWVMRHGGKQRFLEWVVELECGEREDAAERIVRGFNALQGYRGTSHVCGDFIGGVDQWRAMQSRIEQRSSRVRRSGWPICAFSGFAVAALFLRIFDPAARTWTALCVAGAIIAFAWLVWCIAPLLYVVWLSGVPHPAPVGSQASPTNPTPPTNPPRQTEEEIQTFEREPREGF